MENYVQRVVKADSFDDRATFIPAGHIGLFRADKLKADKAKDKAREKDGRISRASDRKMDVSKMPETAIVQIAPIAPTGPNPTMPQQVPPGAVQLLGGYAEPGKLLVAERTKPGEKRKAEVTGGDEAKVNEALGNETGGPELAEENDAPNAGSVATITANLNADTDLDALEKAEKNSSAPRKGVLDAVKAERERRASETA